MKKYRMYRLKRIRFDKINIDNLNIVLIVFLALVSTAMLIHLFCIKSLFMDMFTVPLCLITLILTILYYKVEKIQRGYANYFKIINWSFNTLCWIAIFILNYLNR